MSINSVGTRPAAVQSLLDMRSQLDDLQRQLGSGKKSTTFAGLGVNRGLAASLQAQLSNLQSYGDTITQINVRLTLAQTSLSGIGDIRGSAKTALQQSPTISTSGQSVAQQTARSELDRLLSVLNVRAGDRYLFSGRALDQAAVESTDHILDGDGGRAGLKQVISERAQADLGASGLGRVTVAAAAGTLTLAEDAASSPFGFKLAAVSSNLSGGTVSGPAGSPANITVALASNPAAGEAVTFTFNLPDGTTDTIKLTATASATPGAGEFTIGADPTATAANLQTALTTALGTEAKTALKAASAMAASNDFFDIGAGDPPQRVAGPPFDTATALVAGTSANTVTWYTGEMGTDSPRSTAVAKVDQALSVSYGMRANEEGIRVIVQSIAAFAATSFDPNDSAAGGQYSALVSRVSAGLSEPAGMQKVQDISVEIGDAQTTAKIASNNQTQTSSVLNGLLQDIESAPPEELAVQILALQTQLQASLQTTAALYQLSLTNYI